MVSARQTGQRIGGANWLYTTLMLVMAICFDSKTVFAGHGEHDLRIVVTQDVLVDYELFLSGRDPLDITEFDGNHSRRDVVEIVLLQQALHRGGWLGDVTLLPGGNYADMMQMLANGKADLTGSSTWLSDINRKSQQIAASSAVIAEGRFEAGFYMLADTPHRLKVRNLRGLQLLCGVSSRQWIPDWQTLAKLHFADLFHVPSWELMVQFVAEGRADFLLAPFQRGPDMELVVNGTRFLPIPGYKIVLNGSRHFAVTRVTSYSKDLLTAVDQGLRELERIGRIEQAYRQSGFFNPSVSDWITIGSDGFGQSYLTTEGLVSGFDNSVQNQIFSLSDVSRELYPEKTVF